jgi:predicted RecB family endonuclease
LFNDGYSAWNKAHGRRKNAMTLDDDVDAKGKSELIALMKQTLEVRGVKVEVPGVAQGASRTRHSFDLMANKDGRRIAVDVRLAGTEGVELREVLETYAKSLDAKMKSTVIVAMPNATSEARRSAKSFGLLLVEGSDASQVVELLSEALNEVRY